jgi:PhoPQ-activated pathogenicity-related protein
LHAKIVIATPNEGWTATFIEAKFADGLVSTTPVYVLPKVYPTAAPPVVEPGCKTLADAA